MYCYTFNFTSNYFRRLLVTSLDTTVYSFVYHAIYLTTTPDNASSFRQWIMIFLAADLGYYWFHRAAHGKCATNPHIMKRLFIGLVFIVYTHEFYPSHLFCF